MRSKFRLGGAIFMTAFGGKCQQKLTTSLWRTWKFRGLSPSPWWAPPMIVTRVTLVAVANNLVLTPFVENRFIAPCIISWLVVDILDSLVSHHLQSTNLNHKPLATWSRRILRCEQEWSTPVYHTAWPSAAACWHRYTAAESPAPRAQADRGDM